MTRARQTPKPRSGFTLIELLVVVVIIAVLIALLSAAVFKAFSKGPQVVNQNNITQLVDSAGAFKQKYGVYPPSRIILCKKLADYASVPASLPGLTPAATAQLKQDSVEYLTQAWTRLNTPGGPWTGGPGYVDWDNSGSYMAGWYAVLEGDQCLVFFLGGIPSGNVPGGIPGVQGFSTNPANPAANTVERVGPFYDNFGPTNLVLIPHPASGNASFFSCADNYGQGINGALTKGNVYAYFSSYKTANGYNRYGLSDCVSIGAAPYVQSPGKYFKASSVQVISAGLDGAFGPGGPLAPGGGSGLGAGKDDQCNFIETLMGNY